MTKLSSRPASLCHPNESATLADTKLKRCELLPRRTTEDHWKRRSQQKTTVPFYIILIRLNPGDILRMSPVGQSVISST